MVLFFVKMCCQSGMSVLFLAAFDDYYIDRLIDQVLKKMSFLPLLAEICLIKRKCFHMLFESQWSSVLARHHELESFMFNNFQNS